MKKAKAKGTTTTTTAAPLATPASIAGLVQTATVAEAKAAKKAGPVTLVTREHGVVAAVTLTGAKPYRVGCGHNADWYAAIRDQCEGEELIASVEALIRAEVPTHFVGYCLRNGWLQVSA